MTKICFPNTGGLGLIPGKGIRSSMPQLKILCAAMKTDLLSAATKTGAAK